MSQSELWKALDQQAQAWRSSPVVESFIAELPRNATQRSQGVPGLLQELQAGFSGFGRRPLRMASFLPFALSGPQFGRAKPDPEVFNKWTALAQQVEVAHRETIAWLRATLPGYPIIPAPQLAPGTPLTTREFTWRLVWQPGEQARGLQLLPAPPRVNALLGLSGPQAKALDESARGVASGLALTPEWQEFGEAARSLDEHDRAALRACRAAIRKRLGSEAVDEHEEKLALPRDEYRASVVADEMGRLTGNAHEYVRAFDALDQLIEDAASDVFGQLLAFGPPERMAGVEALDFGPGTPRVVHFSVAGEFWLDTGQLLWLNDALVPDAVMVIGMTMSLDPGEMSQRLTGRVLEGSHEAWGA